MFHSKKASRRHCIWVRFYFEPVKIWCKKGDSFVDVSKSSSYGAVSAYDLRSKIKVTLFV